MSWLKLDDKFATHPKVVGLSDAAFRLHVCAMTYSAEHETDGRITESVAKTLTSHGNKGKLIQELVDAGLWDVLVGGWEIHDFLEWNPSHAELKAKRDAAKHRMDRVRSQSVRANEQRTNENVLSTPTRPDPTRSDPERSRAPESGVFKSDRTPPAAAPAASHTVSAIVREIRRFPIFEKLDAEAIASSHEMWMPTKRPVQRLQWVLESISTCEAKVTGLGLRPEALQSRLVGFMRNATAPREQETPESKTRKAAEADRHDGAMPSLSEVVKRASKAPEAPPVSKERMAELSAMVAGIGKAGAA